MQSRYYSPEWGRFINADNILTETLLGTNVYAYCDDNFDNRLNSNTTNASKGYKSFRQAKKAMGPAGEGRDWHHIVEQCQVKKSGIDVQLINSERNLISIDRGLHRKISSYYSRNNRNLDKPMKIRDWLAGQSYEAQREFGINVIKMFGGM